MKRLLKKIFLFGFGFLAFFSCSFANMTYEGKWANDPMETLGNVVSDANHGYYKIQNTALDGVSDGVSDRQGMYGGSFKITNTLEYFRQNINPYLQWAVYIGLVAATISLIYIGFLLVTNGVTGKGDFSKLKKNMVNVIIGVIILIGFYSLIKIVVAVINWVFG